MTTTPPPEPLPAELRAVLATHLGDTQPARTSLVVQFCQTVRDRREHQHSPDDVFCTNLAAYMGERITPILARLLAAEADAAQLRDTLAETSPDESGIEYSVRTRGGKILDIRRNRPDAEEALTNARMSYPGAELVLRHCGPWLSAGEGTS